jgi:hypothetical protein
MEYNKLLSDIVIGASGGVFAGIGIWAIDLIRTKYQFRKDEKRIVKFFNDHKHENKEFRTTYRIAAEVNLTQSRVIDVCSNSLKIRRNQLELETWALKSSN